jgi:beta-galactosidase
MKVLNVSLFVCCLLSFLSLASRERSIILLDSDWQFKNKDVANAEKVDFDDHGWEKVNVPHDWGIKGPFDMNLDMQTVLVTEDGELVPQLRTGRTGALPIFGAGWYRKVLPLSKEDADKRIFIEFDGAMSLAKIFLNGTYIGEWPYGYASFSFELTGHIQFGEKNVLAVRLENKPKSMRWYSGAGIYRNVRLVKTPLTHVAHWGTYITTPAVNHRTADVNIKTEVTGNETSSAQVKLETIIYSASGEQVASVSSRQRMAPKMIFEQQTTIRNPLLWGIETPNLYTAVSIVYVDNVMTDEYTTKFGCRTIHFDRNQGFFLNGEHVKIRGVCLHHDLGPLGAAFNYRATERQLEIMQEMGANAIRTAHNPPSPELLQICDSMGLLVQLEVFDEWENPKNENGYSLYFNEWAEKDLRNAIRRDRNHPSIIMWSIGNEVREQNHGDRGREIARFLAGICREEDPTRPVTAGFNHHNATIANGMAAEIDLFGMNYKPRDYKRIHTENPDFIVYGSETASTVSSRGEYKFPVREVRSPWYNDYQLSGYDMEYPSWATTPDTEFEMQDDHEFVLGEFVWTGFDYLGEPTPYNTATPARSSYFGIVDLAGLKKDRFYLYQSKWSDEPVLHLLPHWNWHDRIGQVVPVFCYTNYPKAELFVNGQSMGVREKETSNRYTRYRLMWNDVKYQPGEIRIIAYDASNQQVAEKIIRTAGEPHALRMTADRRNIRADGKDLSYVTIEIVDREGNLCPRANNLLFFEIQGEGTLQALCNGDPTDQTSFASNYMKAFNGKLVATLKSGVNAGEIELRVYGGPLQDQKIMIHAE